jgi:prolycopene isomerase
LRFSNIEQVNRSLRWHEAVERGDTDCQMVYCIVPSNFDSHLAPPGKQLLTACTVVPENGGGDAVERHLLASLKSLILGLDLHIEWIDVVSAIELSTFLGKHGIISNAQVIGQVGSARQDVTTPLRGLYIAGDCAGARGIGTELAAASAIICTDRVIKAARTGELPCTV